MKNIYSGVFGLGLLLLPMIGFSTPIFSDNFDAEPVSTVLKYNSFSNWDVTDGTVDIISSGAYGLSCLGGVGKCLDLDGSSSNAGILTTKQAFSLSPGTYELSFAISGNQRSGNDSVTVSLGSVFSETFTKAYGDPFETVTRTILVSSSVMANIVFDHAGGDNLGIMLDDVALTAVPLPSAGWLLLSGMIGLMGFKKRSAST